MADTILIVDDDPGVRGALSLLIEDDGRYRASAVSCASEALAHISKHRVDLVLCDVSMPGMDGIGLLEAIKLTYPDLPVIMISAHGELETAVRAVRAGAYDYLVKPIEQDRLFATASRALELSRLQRDNRALREERASDEQLLGNSSPIQRLRQEIELAAPSDARILILGENGTGKEIVARMIHERSARSDRPFVKLNSAAIPRDLIESELFGHEAGAFTGATKAKKGKFELADGGTLFLDEIGDMALETQAKLLRVLSSGEVERVGGARPYHPDVRFLSATNRDLLDDVEGQRFREDLYHRIAVIPIRVPPLRERGDDLDLLAARFLEEACARVRRLPPAVDPAARRLLLTHTWPGNVRELRNLMERIAIMHRSPVLTAEDLAPMLTPSRGAAPTSQQVVSAHEGPADRWRTRQKEAERELVERVLREVGWRVTLAAERLGIDRASLHRKMRRLGIHRPGVGDGGE